MNEQTFAERLCAALARSGLRTQRALAAESGIDVTYLNRLFRGKVERPTYEIVLALANALRCSVRDLAPWLVVEEAENAPSRQPVPTSIAGAFLPDELIADDEIIAHIESKPDPEFRRQMAVLRQRIDPAEYARVCRRLYRFYAAMDQVVLNSPDLSGEQ